jgi:DNA-binding IclR family transcriptional regulator
MPTNNYISVVDKAMRVLEAMRGKREVPLGEIASSSGLIKSNTFRILFTLERLGYVEKVNGGRYSLTASLARLASGPLPISATWQNLLWPSCCGGSGKRSTSAF